MRILLVCTSEVYEDTIVVYRWCMRILMVCTSEVYEDTIVVYR